MNRATRPRATKAERVERTKKVLALFAKGETAFDIGVALDIHLETVRAIAKDNGIFIPRKNAKTYDKTESRSAEQQLADCERELGAEFVFAAGASGLEGVELQRLHAALRVVLLDADPLIGVVRLRLGRLRREGIDAAATRGLGEMRRTA